MKTLVITAIIASLTSTASFATWNNTNTTTWDGNTGALHNDGCAFKNQSAGAMTLNPETGVWTTTTAATIKVKSKNKNNIKVTSDGVLRKTGGELADTTVNYIGGGVMSNIQTNNSAAVKNTNTNEIALGSANRASGVTITTFTIGGIATMANLDDLNDIDNNQEVFIKHTVTCTQ